KTYPKSSWLKDVLEYQVRLTKQINSTMMANYQTLISDVAASTLDSAAAAMVSIQALAPPAPPTPPVPPAPPGPPVRAFRIGGSPRPDANPELTLQREALRILFENNPDRAIEIAGERLKNDSKDELVLSSLDLFANSKSDKAFPMLVSLAKTSPDPKARR